MESRTQSPAPRNVSHSHSFQQGSTGSIATGMSRSIAYRMWLQIPVLAFGQVRLDLFSKRGRWVNRRAADAAPFLLNVTNLRVMGHQLDLGAVRLKASHLEHLSYCSTADQGSGSIVSVTLGLFSGWGAHSQCMHSILQRPLPCAKASGVMRRQVKEKCLCLRRLP